MAHVLHPDQLRTSADRFSHFFTELGEAFVERDEVLTQFALALLCREHVLMTGPPGTAKSQMASAVLRRVIDEHTGEPSLFSTQFTENTVQTDLIGPINFKTLMASGRTEHFTDEGILGSVHAFLDEVFDGRDMLLRSALGVLNERELKHGAGTTRGQIECAFMTSNRYISEVLESARDTLLAFVDRIAFISFVPRGFATPSNLELVMRRHGGGFGRHELSAQLTVQDLDTLQRATELTYVPEVICDAIAQLVRNLDDELADAKRSDPTFCPTRYLSTRTVVNAADVLRAAVVYDKAFRNPKRSLQANFDDLSMLRYYLVLNGLNRGDVANRLDSETDPHERRQLEIMRTEAEIFDRCLSNISRVKIPDAPRALDMDALTKTAAAARASGDPKQLAEAARQLIAATESGARGTDKAAALLVDTVSQLTSQALEAGLTSAIGGEEALMSTAEDLVRVATSLEQATGSGRHTAQWLRGRVLSLLDDAARLAPAMSAESITALAFDVRKETVDARIQERLNSFEAVYNLRHQLLAGGAWQPDTDASKNAWLSVVAKLEQELELLLDAEFRIAAQNLLAAADATSLNETLDQLRPIVDRLQATVTRVAELGDDTDLLQRVVGPRLAPLLARVFTRLDGNDRGAVIAEVENVVAELSAAGLDHVITPARFVEWSVPALVRAEEQRAAAEDAVTSREQFEQASAAEDRISIGETLVEIAIRASTATPPDPHRPSDTPGAVFSVLRELGTPLKDQIIAMDLARVERGLRSLEQWWASLSADHQDAATEAEQTVQFLESVVESGFLRVVRSEGVPLRLALEAKRLGEVFPSCADRVSSLRERIQSVDTNSAAVLSGLLKSHADRAWNRTFSG